MPRSVAVGCNHVSCLIFVHLFFAHRAAALEECLNIDAPQGWIGEDARMADAIEAGPEQHTGAHTGALSRTSWPRSRGLPKSTGAPARRMGGVGISLASRPREGNKSLETYVSGIIPGFPAHDSGQICVDDVVVMVDRLKLTRATKLTDVNTLIRGTAGTCVELTLIDAMGNQKTVSLARVAHDKGAGSIQLSPSRSSAPSSSDLFTPVRQDMGSALLFTPLMGAQAARVGQDGKKVVHSAVDDLEAALNTAEEALLAAESAHLAAAFLLEENARLRDRVSFAEGKAFAATERASDAEERSAHLGGKLSMKEQEILQLAEQCRRFQDQTNASKALPFNHDAPAAVGPPPIHTAFGSSRSVLALASSRTDATKPLNDPSVGASLAEGITSAFSIFNPFGAAMGAPSTGGLGAAPTLPFMLQKAVNDTPVVQGKHRVRQNSSGGSMVQGQHTASRGRALWELGADISPAPSPPLSLGDSEISRDGAQGLPKLWKLGDTPRRSLHSSDEDGEVESGGGEVRGKELSDDSSDFEDSASDACSPVSASRYNRNGSPDAHDSARNAPAAFDFQQLPRNFPTDAGALAPRGRPSGVHKLDRDSDGFPIQGLEEPGDEEHPRLCIANLPRGFNEDQGALAPRGKSGDFKGIYEAAGFVSLRGMVRALAGPLCEEVAAIAAITSQLSEDLGQAEREQKRRAQEIKARLIEPPSNASEALEQVSEALRETEELRAVLAELREGSMTRLSNVEIESCFKIQVKRLVPGRAFGSYLVSCGRSVVLVLNGSLSLSLSLPPSLSLSPLSLPLPLPLASSSSCAGNARPCAKVVASHCQTQGERSAAGRSREKIPSERR